MTTLWLMLATTTCWFLGALLSRTRAENLYSNANQHWASERLESQ
ncbi:hypothetical protein [Xylella taiwanensis]|uniref:Uncharacterized protein n=1 Tax=Xylella taiwanensis TaxID=1444770 RepID=Z9JJE8_9GAMM|nr:hypothetical protein [Xylella taiwanensis]EWS77961.1 hypothetical protein AF72_08220 [Xylella taiwanensis]